MPIVKTAGKLALRPLKIFRLNYEMVSDLLKCLLFLQPYVVPTNIYLKFRLTQLFVHSCHVIRDRGNLSSKKKTQKKLTPVLQAMIRVAHAP